MATEVAKKESSAVAVEQFEDLGGLGFEETTSQDMAVPFLRILAQLSPQVNKRDGAYVEGAEAGMMFNTVANKVYDGEKGVTVVPCYYNRRYVEWAPREKGGGYFGSYNPDDPIVNTTTKNERGEDNLAKDLLAELGQRGMQTQTKTWVEPMTLKSFVKEQVEKGENLPYDLLGIFVGQRAKIRR